MRATEFFAATLTVAAPASPKSIASDYIDADAA
jgi:hypothetical protein